MDKMEEQITKIEEKRQEQIFKFRDFLVLMTNAFLVNISFGEISIFVIVAFLGHVSFYVISVLLKCAICAIFFW